MAYTLYIIFPPQKFDLCKVPSNNKKLIEYERDELQDLITKCELLFNVTLGTWKTKFVDIELHNNSKPHHTKLYSVPRLH